MKQPMTGFGRKVIPPPPVKQQPPFKFNQLARPVPQASIGMAPQPPEVDFVGRYNELLGNRPDRLAYREHALQGPPTIERGKWAKLGALLAAGGTSLGSGSAQQGMNLGLSAYYEPERKARETWEMQRSNLGELANMEDTDIQGKLGALEMENSNYWDRRRTELSEAELAERKRSSIVGEGQTDRQINLQGFKPYEDPTDGMTYLYNIETKERTPVGRTGFTTEEQLGQEAARLRQELTIKEPYDIRSGNRQHQNRLGEIEATGKIQNTVAETKGRATIEAARTRALNKIATLPKEEQQMINNIVQNAARDPLFEGVSPLDYLDFDPIRKVAFVRPPSKGFMGIGGDDENDTLIRERLRAIIAGSYGPQGAQPAVRNGDSMTTTTPSTVTYTVPGQGDIEVAPEEVEELLRDYPTARRK